MGAGSDEDRLLLGCTPSGTPRAGYKLPGPWLPLTALVAALLTLGLLSMRAQPIGAGLRLRGARMSVIPLSAAAWRRLSAAALALPGCWHRLSVHAHDCNSSFKPISVLQSWFWKRSILG